MFGVDFQEMTWLIPNSANMQQVAKWEIEGEEREKENEEQREKAT